MSQISRALKRIQEIRHKEGHAKIEETAVPVSTFAAAQLSRAEGPGSNDQGLWLWIIGTLIIVSMLMSATALFFVFRAQSSTNKVVGLLETIKIQDKKINELIIAINKSKNISKSQIDYINVRLEDSARDLKGKINALSSDTRDNYSNLKDAILDEKQQVGSLDTRVKQLDQKLETLSASVNQAEKTNRDAAIPASSI